MKQLLFSTFFALVVCASCQKEDQTPQPQPRSIYHWVWAGDTIFIDEKLTTWSSYPDSIYDPKTGRYNYRDTIRQVTFKSANNPGVFMQFSFNKNPIQTSDYKIISYAVLSEKEVRIYASNYIEPSDSLERFIHIKTEGDTIHITASQLLYTSPALPGFPPFYPGTPAVTAELSMHLMARDE